MSQSMEKYRKVAILTHSETDRIDFIASTPNMEGKDVMKDQQLSSTVLLVNKLIKMD